MLRALPRLIALVAPVFIAPALTAPVLAANGPAAERELSDLYYGEAQYYARQGRYFDALQRLDTELAQHYGLDEPELDSLYRHIHDAEFSVGDFELSYRMHHRAGRAIRAVLEGEVDEAVRNDAAYRLARIHFQKNQLDDALRALDRIEGRMPGGLASDVDFLRANIYLATDRPAEAVGVLRSLKGAEDLTGFADYNLGIALLRAGRRGDALSQLDRAGRVRAGDAATLAIRDKANLVLGAIEMESGAYDDAVEHLERVRLQGPLSNLALLRAGWAAVSADRYDRAVVPWSILARREQTDAAVQEALLALPYAYGQLDVHGRAAVLYGRALETFDTELDKLDASIDSIREGRFLEALIREEIRRDEDWVIRLRELPQTPETYYLMELMASHAFQAGLRNYLDLEDLRVRLASWQSSFDAFDDLIGLRRGYYEPLLPRIDARFRQLDARMRLRQEQYQALEQRLRGMLTSPRPDLLATAEERWLGQRLQRIRDRLAEADGERAEALRRRVRRLEGVLIWRLRTQYHERLTRLHEHVQALSDSVEAMNRRYARFVRVRQAASHSYVGYEGPIKRLRTRVGEALRRVERLMARQGRMLEVVAVNELKVRRRRLEQYRGQALFALGDSYDRASQALPDAAKEGD